MSAQYFTLVNSSINNFEFVKPHCRRKLPSMELKVVDCWTRSQVMSRSNDNEFSEAEENAHDGDPSENMWPPSDAQRLRRRVMDLDRSVCRTRQSQRRFLIQIHMASSADIVRDPVLILNRMAGNEMYGRVVDWD